MGIALVRPGSENVCLRLGTDRLPDSSIARSASRASVGRGRAGGGCRRRERGARRGERRSGRRRRGRLHRERVDARSGRASAPWRRGRRLVARDLLARGRERRGGNLLARGEEVDGEARDEREDLDRGLVQAALFPGQLVGAHEAGQAVADHHRHEERARGRGPGEGAAERAVLVRRLGDHRALVLEHGGDERIVLGREIQRRARTRRVRPSRRSRRPSSPSAGRCAGRGARRARRAPASARGSATGRRPACARTRSAAREPRTTVQSACAGAAAAAGFGAGAGGAASSSIRATTSSGNSGLACAGMLVRQRARAATRCPGARPRGTISTSRGDPRDVWTAIRSTGVSRQDPPTYVS